MKRSNVGYWMVAPAVLVLVGLTAYPFFLSIYMSFTNKTLGKTGNFIGIKNYIDLFNSPTFRQVAFNTTIYTIGAILLKAIFGMLLALILDKIKYARNFFRSVVLLPWVVPATVSILSWLWIFHPTGSVVNQSLGLNIPWLYNIGWARFSVILVNSWRGLPFFAITFLAGLVSIPEELYDAASIDGAGPFQRFSRITLPLLKPILGIVLMFSIVRTVGDFVVVHILTGGGPLNTTHVFGTYAYQIGLSGSRIGKGAAISLFIFPVLALSAFFLLRAVKGGETFG